MAFAKILVSALLVATTSAAPQLSGLNNLGGLAASPIDEPEDAYPIYTYAFQVASDEKQTYIAKEESRDGDDVTGEYSYVDPLGNLITVTYTAGVMGYTEERNVQPNFVQIRAGNVGAAAPVAVQQTTTTTSNSGGSSSNLVAQIISQLTPFIRDTVSGSLGGSSRTTTTTSSAPAVQTVRRVVQTAAAPTVVASAAPAVSNIFGVEGANNVRFNTPEFDFAYDLQK